MGQHGQTDYRPLRAAPQKTLGHFICEMTARGARLGLIGGLGIGATTFYYQELVRAHQLSGCIPDLTIVHADVDQVLEWVNAGNGAFRGIASHAAPKYDR